MTCSHQETCVASNCIQLNLQPGFTRGCRASISPVPNARSCSTRQICSNTIECAKCPMYPIVPSTSCKPCSPCGPYVPCVPKVYPCSTLRVICMSTCPPYTSSTYRC